MRYLPSVLLLLACGGSQPAVETAPVSETVVDANASEPTAFRFVTGDYDEMASSEPNDDNPVSTSEGEMSIRVHYHLGAEAQEFSIDTVQAEFSGPYGGVTFDLHAPPAEDDELSSEHAALIALRPEGSVHSRAFVVSSTRTLTHINAYHVVRGPEGYRIERQSYEASDLAGSPDATTEVLREL